MWLIALALASPYDPPPAAPVPDAYRWTATPDPAHATVPADPDPIVEAALTEAMRYAELPWTWNGRGTDRLPGIDCMGLLFRAYGTATGTPWRDHATDPSKLVASGKLGPPVPGLDGVLRGEVDPTKLRRGDIVYFLVKEQEIPDAPLMQRDGARYWPWHVGVYVGEGKQLVLNAHPTFDVVRMPLDAVLWDAIFVTRPRP